MKKKRPDPTQRIEERRQKTARRLHGRKASVEELAAIAHRIAAGVKRPRVDHAELLYDETGLPK